MSERSSALPVWNGHSCPLSCTTTKAAGKSAPNERPSFQEIYYCTMYLYVLYLAFSNAYWPPEHPLQCLVPSRKRPCQRRSTQQPSQGPRRKIARPEGPPASLYGLSVTYNGVQQLTRRDHSRLQSPSTSSAYPVLPAYPIQTPHPSRSRDEKSAPFLSAVISFHKFALRYPA